MSMFSWGAGSRKGLRRSDVVVDSNSGVHFVRPKSKIQDISVGRRIAAFLRGDGNVDYLWSVESSDGKAKPGKLNSLNLKEKIKEIRCGDAHVVLISHGGKVFLMDTTQIPRCMKGLNSEHITQVACGDQHSIALSQGGQLFTWGQNSNGQLGLGKGEPSTMSPQPLKSLAGIPLSQISAGGDHSFVLSLSGAVFGWGKNSAGQLGLGDLSDRPEPVDVSCLSLKKTIFISCGTEHTAILVKDGVVFTCGSGRYGQLGHNSFRDELRPRLVAELWGSKVSQIACGKHHTLALVGSSKIYSFGRGDQGQLGNGQIVNQCVPLSTCALITSVEQRVTKLIAGGNLSFALFDSTQECQKGPAKHKPTIKKREALDEKKIDKWISGCNSSWKRIQSEITAIFSSASSINGSFLETGCDEHYKTSTGYSGLDLSLARIAFEKLSTTKKERRVMMKVSQVVEQHLLPSLSPSPAGVEGLRVYLILPELLRVLLKQHRGTDLAVLLAEAILRLHPDSLKALGMLWSSLSGSFIGAFVTTFRSVCETLLVGIPKRLFGPEALQKVVEVLQRVYEATHRRQVPENMFQIKNIIAQTTLKMLESCPCIFDLEAKYAVFKGTAEKMKASGFSNFWLPPAEFELTVRRTELLESVLSQLRSADHHQFRMPLKVKFEEEDGVDIGGVSRAFFKLITNAFSTEGSKTLEIYDDSQCVWFRPDRTICTGTSESLYLGMIFGMALYNLCTVDSTYPQALFKKLLGLKPTLEDLEELSPCQARGLKQLLDEDEDVIDDLYLDFCVKGHDLIQDGGNVLVSKANRKRYVDLYVDYVLNTSVTRQFEDFSKGFDLGCPCRTWTMFRPDELMNTLCGEVEYQWEELQKNAIYICTPTDKTVKDFWKVFFEYSDENKKKFLSFVQGTDRLPVGGLAKLRLTVSKLNVTNADERYPQASTCYISLALPNYSTIHTLRKNLTHAINHCEEFGCS
ncbi:probable E3 ubiquitin-protein ligase HERC3 isoform X5 [Alosa sapidissima]|uniref:probable E3 ubiquitin-protein ligase HERC3 isoform X5 n=1 Tax=Alosa sapidissima TaxID=34773 RepID=UPI001C08D435|nr:probable E3 ubiquitin-protein ligase HERC3 isoform X5 [Alosa sapidissima]